MKTKQTDTITVDDIREVSKHLGFGDRKLIAKNLKNVTYSTVKDILSPRENLTINDKVIDVYVAAVAIVNDRKRRLRAISS